MVEHDVRDAKFYVIDKSDGAGNAQDVVPLSFEAAFERAQAIAGSGREVHVMYTDEATQMQLTRLATHGIPASLVPQG